MASDYKSYILDTSALLTYIKLIQSLSINVIESHEIFNIQAGKLKAFNKISLADAYIAALVQMKKGILVHKDPDYEKITPHLDQMKLPYKK